MIKYLPILAIIIMVGCVTDDKYDVTYTVPAHTIDGVLLDMTVSYQVRCSITGVGTSVIDTFGQISMLLSHATLDESTEVEALFISHAKKVCRV
jgi:hypothetical protein